MSAKDSNSSSQKKNASQSSSETDGADSSPHASLNTSRSVSLDESPDTVLLWFRRDLRLRDNPALSAAANEADRVVCVFIHDPSSEEPWAPGEASDWWLHHSLASLQEQLAKHDQKLIFRAGESLSELRSLAKSVKADAVYWNRIYEPAAIERDTKIKKALRDDGLHVKSFNASLLFEPTAHETQSGDPYKVFTPFYKQLLAKDDPHPAFEVPKEIPVPKGFPDGLELDDLNLLPKIDWAGGMREAWTPGEPGARQRVLEWSQDGVRAYDDRRDLPGEDGVSRLSPYLHFGEIGPRDLWHHLSALRRKSRGKASDNIQAFLRQIVWREFAHHLLYHFPHTTWEPLRENFADFPWESGGENLKLWQKGQTGYPIVDAGMRELWHTGYMHNRVRMITASFLVKHLLITWHEGAKWFWDTLVDADLANNTLGWQWVAGSGADAAPYFRIFNPILQGKKFDSHGAYVRRWVPEIAKLDDKHLHTPWEASDEVLEKAGIKLGKTYPEPLVEHGFARDRALSAYDKIKGGG